MPHSMKYPTTWLPPGPRAAELDGPAAANGIATATAVRITKAATRRPVFMSPLFGGVHKWFVPLLGERSLSRNSLFVNSRPDPTRKRPLGSHKLTIGLAWIGIIRTRESPCT
jgi:hypothetical protein